MGPLAVNSRECVTVLSGTRSVSNGLDPDQDQYAVGPDLGPNCLQRLSADDKIKWPLARKEFIPVRPLAVGSREGVTVLSGTLYSIYIYSGRSESDHYHSVKWFGSRPGPTFYQS